MWVEVASVAKTCKFANLDASVQPTSHVVVVVDFFVVAVVVVDFVVVIFARKLAPPFVGFLV